MGDSKCFQRETQVRANELSARAQGKKVDDPSEAPEVAVTRLSSGVTIKKEDRMGGQAMMRGLSSAMTTPMTASAATAV